MEISHNTARRNVSTTGRFQIQSRTTNGSSSDLPLGTLAKAPPEIRDMIYRHIFAVGHTALTRASKDIYEDTKEALRKYGIYRHQIQSSMIGGLFFANRLHPDYYGCRSQPPKHVLQKVQRLLIVVDVVYYDYHSKYNKVYHRRTDNQLQEILRSLTADMQRKRTCHVKLLYGPYPEITHHTLDAMAQLRGFESITVELCRQPTSPRQWTSDTKAIERIELALRQMSDESSTKKYVILETELEEYSCSQAPVGQDLAEKQEGTFKDSRYFRLLDAGDLG